MFKHNLTIFYFAFLKGGKELAKQKKADSSV